MNQLAPLRDRPVNQKPWEGDPAAKKPWDYRVTVAIPVIDGGDYLPLCLELILLQTEPVFVMLIDTGSQPEHWKLIESLRSEQVEVHALRLNGVRHPSDFPAMAMDFAFTLCRSEYLFATHQDVFLRRQDFVADLLETSRREQAAVVGYEITPRAHDDWRGMVSHTASLYHLPAMDRSGVGWSLRRLGSMYGITDYSPDPARPSWPDTEILPNYLFRSHGLKTHLIGHEQNYRRTLDENIDHPRSIPSASLYSPGYTDRVQADWQDAIDQARLRVQSWKEQG